MARVSIYLNFNGTTEEAFSFYEKVFGTKIIGKPMKMKDVPPHEGQTPLSPSDQELIMHVMMPILGGTIIMGTDATESMGMSLRQGNNMYINLEPDTRSETDLLFNKLSEGGTVELPLQEMFWGDYFGSLTDRFGIQWMFNCTEKK